MKNSNDTIWNRTRDLPACSAVPQPTALPRAPIKMVPYKNQLGGGDVEWIDLGQDNGKLMALVNTVMNVWVP